LNSQAFAAAFSARLHPGMTVALGDGAGMLGADILAALSSVARDLGSLRLVLGWLPAPARGLDPDAFAEVIALMPSAGARDLLGSPAARCVPARISAWPALLTGPLRPDLLITRVVQRDDALNFGSEVSFQRGLAEAGIPIVAVLDTETPAASAEPPLSAAQLSIIGVCSEPPAHLHREPEPVHEALADAVLRFISAGARVQYGPGPLGTALLRRATVPLAIDSGLLTDAVVDLDRRGLLIGQPSATYLAGTERLYEWADGRPLLRGIEHTHDVTRLSRDGPFVAVNTAVEIDPVGQVNVEGIADKTIGGIGGHPDYCAAARASPGGLSIIATPSRVNGRSPFVQQLSRPASTPAHDVDLIVTESGHADLRDADWPQRRKLITELFDA
jgi:acyl CoA:acetate/3-ketoacid CoA transferase beta subunit